MSLASLAPSTRAVWEALQELLPEGEGAVSNWQISVAAGVTTRTVSRSLRRLEAMGWVVFDGRRGRPRGDRRSLRKKMDGGVHFKKNLCARCRLPATNKAGKPTGKWCPRCKQAMREDRVWVGPLIRRARQMIREDGRVDVDRLAVLIRRRFPQAELYTRARAANANETPGIWQVLDNAGLLDEVQRKLWQERQSAARDGIPGE